MIVFQELRERVLRGKYRIPFYMSTDCENLLKKFLVLNPTRRAALEAIMKDKWMNINYENEELRPYEEPTPDFNDNYRIGSFFFFFFFFAERDFSLQKPSHVIAVIHAIKSSSP